MHQEKELASSSHVVLESPQTKAYLTTTLIEEKQETIKSKVKIPYLGGVPSRLCPFEQNPQAFGQSL